MAGVAVGFDGEGRLVVLCSDDLAELVCGDEGIACFFDLDGHGGDADGGLAVGCFEQERAGTGVALGGELDACELGLWGA